ncbi:MAG: 3-deoxy-manno-octulosonate cytidylyltransferase [Flavobacteriales bacterium]
MDILGIIPARYASSRFEGKPLANIAGKSMVQRVFESASLATSLNELWVATDDERIFREVESFGGLAVMTSLHHPNGTARCLEAALNIRPECDVVVNIQGDEPLINPAQIELLTGLFKDDVVNIATLAKRTRIPAEISDPNVVKVRFGENGKALYFGRKPVAGKQVPHYKHIGMYAYRLPVLKKLVDLPQADDEKRQSLEQLRWMQHGFDVYVAETDCDSVSVDTPADLEKVLEIIKRKKR